LSGNAEVATLEFRSAERYERERITLSTDSVQSQSLAVAAADPGTPLRPAGAGV
jgi:hypothetical protein